MNKMLLASIALTFGALASAEVPAGSDSVNGAFARMLEDRPGIAIARGPTGDPTGSQFEGWVNAATRGDMSSLEAGFANLLAQADDSPRALPVRGERDPVEAMITQALQTQRLTARLHAAR